MTYNFDNQNNLASLNYLVSPHPQRVNRQQPKNNIFQSSNNERLQNWTNRELFLRNQWRKQQEMKSQNSSQYQNKFFEPNSLRQQQQSLNPNKPLQNFKLNQNEIKKPSQNGNIENEIQELQQKLAKLQKERELEFQIEQQLNQLDSYNKENNANAQNYQQNNIETYQQKYAEDNQTQNIDQYPPQLQEQNQYYQEIDNQQIEPEQSHPFYPSSLSTLKRLQQDQFINKQESTLWNNKKVQPQQKASPQKQMPQTCYQYSTNVNEVLHESPGQYAPQTLSNSSLNHNYIDYFTKLTQKLPQSTVDLQSFSNNEKKNLIKKNCQALTRMTDEDSENRDDMKYIQKNVDQFRRRLQVVAQRNPMNEVEYYKTALENRLLANLKIERKQRLIQILRNERYL